MRPIPALIVGFVFLAAVSWSIVHTNATVIMLAVGGIAVFLITIVRVDIGLSLLVLFLPMTKQFEMQTLASAPLDVGTDDIMVFCLIFGWLGYCARTKTVALPKTDLNRPMLVLLLVMLFSLVRIGLHPKLGMTNVMLSLLHIMKWFEHALLFFLVLSVVEKRRDIEHYLWLLFVGCGLVALVQFVQMATGNFTVQTYTPLGLLPRVGSVFDSIGILGAYYVLFACILAARALEAERRKMLWIYLAGVVIVSAALFTTYARGAYVGLVAGVVMLGVVSGKRRGAVIALAAVVLIPAVLNPWARVRVGMTVKRVEELGPGWHKGLEFEESAKARLEVWRRWVGVFMERPVLGMGFWGVRYHGAFGQSTPHSQYLTLLAELGLVGFFVVVWLGVRILRTVMALIQASRAPPLHSLGIGYLCGFLGVLTHALFGETLQAFRLMGPLWVLTGLVYAGLRIAQAEASEAEEAADVEAGSEVTSNTV